MAKGKIDVYSTDIIEHLNRIVPCRAIEDFYKEDDLEKSWDSFDHVKDNMCLLALKDPTIFSVVASVLCLVIFLAVLLCLACVITCKRANCSGCCNSSQQATDNANPPRATPTQGTLRRVVKCYNLKALEKMYQQ